MTTPEAVDRQAVLDAERAVNEQYLRAMNDLIERAPEVVRQVSVTQSAIWGSKLPSAGIGRGAMSPIIGRVALAGEDEDLGDSFYIAGWRQELPDIQAVSWAAPVAKLFFQGNDSNYNLLDHPVTGRRTFVLRLDDLIDYQDDVEADGQDPFAGRERRLEVPAGPKRRERPAPFIVLAGAKKAHDVLRDSADQTAELPEVPEPALPPVDIDDLSDVAPLDLDEELRAGLAVAKVMEMPKTGRLASVLATMQPDQYGLVSWPHDKPLIVQGQPGTGKTVIATHRAAFLTHEERKDNRVTRIALIGPSDQYVDHVTPLISEVKDQSAQIRVLSLPAYLRQIAGLQSLPKPGRAELIESSWALGRAVDRAIRAMPSRPSTGQIGRKVQSIVDLFRRADETMFPEPDVLHFVQSLPLWAELSSQDRYLPFLATIALTLEPSQAGGKVGHLIVDEAQDVTPIEWRLLTTHVLEPGGHLTLFGDTNQRRSDWCAASWEELSQDLGLTDEGGEAPVRKLTNGYRSTREILRYANRLLPRGARPERALRRGPAPEVVKVKADQLARAVAAAAVDLTTRHEGLIAVISLETARITTELRKRAWSGARHGRWTNGTNTIAVLTPDQARGLEFDAVVVVEPSDFPENVGRQGLLYTSLTRANKELTVVHTSPVPKDLR